MSKTAEATNKLLGNIYAPVSQSGSSAGLSGPTSSSLCRFFSSYCSRRVSSSSAERYRESWALWNSMIWSKMALSWFKRDWTEHTGKEFKEACAEISLFLEDYHCVCVCVLPCCCCLADIGRWWCPGRRRAQRWCGRGPGPAALCSTARPRSTPAPAPHTERRRTL